MNILFVSKYNRIRSKLAESLFASFNRRRDIAVSSAGIFAGDPTPRAVHELADNHRLRLKSRQSTISSDVIGQQDLIVIVGDDVPRTLFSRHRPMVKELMVWKVSAVSGTDADELGVCFDVIAENVRTLVETFKEAPKELTKVEQVISDLYDKRDRETVQLWQKIGMPVKKYYGVSLENLRAQAERIGTNHKLAEKLWKSNIHDARLLAVMIDDPMEVTEHQIETWLRQASFWDITDKIATELIAHTDFGETKVKTWIRERNDNTRRTGWILVYEYAKRGSMLTDKDFESYLGLIRSTISRETNWVKEAMNYALIAIGRRSPELHAKALKVAERVGTIMIDYGDNTTIAPNAHERLQKVAFGEELVGSN